MRFSTVIYAAAFSGVVLGQNNRNGGNNNNGGTAGGNAGGNAALALDADVVQTGSQNDGGDGGVAADGQSLSATSDNNFINFCSGKTLTNGLQVEGGSCNGIPMGDIPSKGNMISAVIINPATGATVAADTTFDISVQVQNLVAGSFTNAQETYYSAPQALQGGNVVGHTHVTVQDMGNNLNPTQPLDPTVFAFFKGINDDGNGNGLLSATVTGGLPAGNYRVCSMTSSSNHQPVLMPVAQRGAQDDCTKFVVEAGGGGNNNNNNNNNAGNNAGNDAGNNAGNNAGDAADNNAGDNTGNNAGDAADNAGDNTGNNAGDTADNTAGDNTGNAGDNTATDGDAAATTTEAAAPATTAADAAATSAAAPATGNNNQNQGGTRFGGGNRGGRFRGGGGRQRRSRSFIS